jgi:hypothetical protein
VPYTIQRFSGQQSLIKFVQQAVLRIGRGTSAGLRLDDPMVALEHAVIEHHQGAYRLTDRGGASGTYLNGRPIREAVLAADDLIAIGGFEIRVQITHPDDPLFLTVWARPSFLEEGQQQPPVAAEEEPRESTPPPAVPREAASQPPALPHPPPSGGDRLPAAAASSAAMAADHLAAPPAPPAPTGSPAQTASPGPPRQQAPAERPPPAPPRGGGPRAPSIDYLRAFGLRRRFFNKALLSVVLALAAAAALLALPLTGRTKAFEPGGVHRWHTEVTSCASCHAPWRGAQATLCADCHATQRQKGEIHQARQIFAPPCTSCHPEHRGGERLAFVDDRTCAACHADLQVTAGEPRFARSVRSFDRDHPDFAVTLPGGARMPLAEAVARRADPTPLLFSHQRHLRAGLPTPNGRRVQLGCDTCHRLAAGAGQTGMTPVTYQESCANSGCHPLTFDNQRPDAVAPHDSPQRVREFLLSVYSDRRAKDQSVGAQYRLLVRGQGASPRGLDFGAQAGRGEVLAERYLYGTACKECHLIDANATPLPVVKWTPIPQRWLPNAHFSHLDHRASPCLDCHAAAPESTAAADVLLPGVAVCQRCHGGSGGATASGGGERPPAALVRAARTDCISCHSYHPRSPEAARSAAVPAPPAAVSGG